MGHGQTLPVREDVPSLDDLQLFPSLDQRNSFGVKLSGLCAELFAKCEWLWKCYARDIQ
jgi:hypothetical protein